MRPASPVVCKPLVLLAPVIGWFPFPSENRASCGLPLVSEVTVDVADSELTTLLLPFLLITCNTVPDGFETWRLLPSAPLS